MWRDVIVTVDIPRACYVELEDGLQMFFLLRQWLRHIFARDL